MAEVHVLGWRAAYRGAVLDRRSIGDRSAIDRRSMS